MRLLGYTRARNLNPSTSASCNIGCGFERSYNYTERVRIT